MKLQSSHENSRACDDLLTSHSAAGSSQLFLKVWSPSSYSPTKLQLPNGCATKCICYSLNYRSVSSKPHHHILKSLNVAKYDKAGLELVDSMCHTLNEQSRHIYIENVSLPKL